MQPRHPDQPQAPSRPFLAGPFDGVAVLGAGTAFPPDAYSNEEALRAMAATLWPREPDPEQVAFVAKGAEDALGVRSRAWAHVPGKPFAHGQELTTIDLGADAALRAIGDAGIEAGAIDLVLASTSTPPRMTSTVSGAIGAKLGVRVPCMDVRTGCSGGLFALATAAMYLGAGCQRVLLVGTETFSKVIPPRSKAAAVALGDGAGAIVLGKASHTGASLRSVFLCTDGGLGHLISTDGALPPTDAEIARGGYVLGGGADELGAELPGKYTHAIAGCLEHAGMSGRDADLFVPHQTSVPLIRGVAARAGLDEARTFVNVPKHANVGSAGWLVALAEARAEGRLARGARALVASVGGGMSWAAAVLVF
jgi:3-oxoacyl-[acyl-carrier-protein] synthase-3